mmetsp:Transcript_76322/g.184648  ORF Transcript_76322/g.184648 Transcript_76322/m.184648 type:complete len:542 (+) Transcript_76322:73-1698(+)
MQLCSRFCFLPLSILVNAKFDDSGFFHWFDEELQEVTNAQLKFEGEVPSYIRGHFVQAGTGTYRMGNSRTTHAFDGYGKIHRLHFGPDGIAFSSNFLRSNFYNESVAKNTIVPALFAGHTIPPMGGGPKAALLGRNDNNLIKSHKIGGTEMYLSDTPVAVVMKDNFARVDEVLRPSLMAAGISGKSWADSIEVFAHICATSIMAHGQTDPHTGRFVGAMSCVSPVDGILPIGSDYHLVFEIDPAEPDKRKLLAKIELTSRKASYMHSMAHTQNKVVLIAQPLHVNVVGIMEGKPMAEGALMLGNGTIFQVVDRKSGSVREFHHTSFLFSHIVNAWEEDDDILIDLTWYQSDWHMVFFGQFKFSNLQKEVRDKWPTGKIMRFRLRHDGTVQEEDLLPKESGSNFELPAINGRLHGVRRHCVAWFWQSAVNAYDEEWDSTKVGPVGTYGLAKRNFCSGERRGFYAPNEYPGEVAFVPDPESTEEDAGALVGMVIDTNKNSSYVQILDAKTMQRIARADLPVRVPFTVHSSFYPEGTPEKLMMI